MARRGLGDLDKLCEGRSERSPTVFNRKLDWNTTLDRDLIEITRASVIGIDRTTSTLRVTHCVLFSLVSVLKHPNFLLDFFLLTDQTHIRGQYTAAIRVEVGAAVLLVVRLVRALDQLVPRLAAKERLARQQGVPGLRPPPR